ncbi:MAG: acyl-CoA dehydrogenase family protein [Nitrospinae bacterium]|nr:acyl-CoA dehydrogenase family protein [Nitrospinota bacterium]
MPNLKNESRSPNPLGQEKFASRTKMIDHEPRFPAENYQGLADAGLLALMVPREFGGSGKKNWDYRRALITAC